MRGEGRSSACGTESALSEHHRKLQSWVDNLLPAHHAAPSRHRLLLFPKKGRFPGGAVCQGCFVMSLLLQVRRSQAGLVSASDKIHRKALDLWIYSWVYRVLD